jgi:hypothetical protein
VSALGKQVEKLEAKIQVIDNATKNLDKITNSFVKQMKQMQKQNNEVLKLKASMEKLRTQTNKKTEVKVNTKKAQSEVNHLTKALLGLQKVASRTGGILGGMRSSLTPSMGGIIGGAATAGAAGYGIQRATSSTVGKSLEFNMISKQIELIGKTRKLDGQKVLDLAEQTSLTSIFDQSEIYNAFAGMMSYSKNEGQVKKLADMAQLLAYTDPLQGMGGGKIAIQELLSGDAKSLYMRFEKIPKSIADELATFADKNDLTKGGNLDKFIDLFNTRMTSTGFDQNFVKEIENTPYGKWLSVMENIQVIQRKIGDAALPRVIKMIDKFNNAMKNGGVDRTAKLFGKLADNIAKLGERGLESFIKNAPKLEKGLDKLFDKFGDTVDGLLSGDLTLDKAISGWITGGINALDKAIKDNQKTIESSSSTLVGYVVNAIETNTPAIASAGFGLGAAMAKGIVDGIASNPIISTLAGAGLGAMVGGPIGALIGAVGGLGVGAGDKITTGLRNADKKADEKSDLAADIYSGRSPLLGGKNAEIVPTKPKKKAFGQPRVPRDNYPILAHEGERLLTKQQANQQDNKTRGQVLVTGNTFVVREEADIEKIAKEFVRQIELHRINFGGATD